jgi:hypothetical protein
MECSNQFTLLLPVFYHVPASEVRAATALPNGHGNELENNRWKGALTSAANVAGKVLERDR